MSERYPASGGHVLKKAESVNATTASVKDANTGTAYLIERAVIVLFTSRPIDG